MWTRLVSEGAPAATRFAWQHCSNLPMQMVEDYFGLLLWIVAQSRATTTTTVLPPPFAPQCPLPPPLIKQVIKLIIVISFIHPSRSAWRNQVVQHLRLSYLHFKNLIWDSRRDFLDCITSKSRLVESLNNAWDMVIMTTFLSNTFTSIVYKVKSA